MYAVAPLTLGRRNEGAGGRCSNGRHDGARIDSDDEETIAFPYCLFPCFESSTYPLLVGLDTWTALGLENQLCHPKLASLLKC